MKSDLQLAVVVPFHSGLRRLEECLAALVPLTAPTEVVVVSDGARESCHALAARYGARVLEIEGPRGPAVARNRGAAACRGDVLVFVDADVVPAAGALDQFREVLERRPEVAAVFGAYDEHPRELNFVSQYKNLAHSYIHQSSSAQAKTFWAGLGAIRRDAFEAVGGFDERFGRPSVEDIELGYRLTASGYAVLLEPSIRGCHLKRWNLRSALVSDLRDRGIPWTQLILQAGRIDNDLNLRISQRLAVVFSYGLVACLGLAVIEPLWLAPAAASLTALVGLSWRHYVFLATRRGTWFAFRSVPLHIAHHLSNGLAFMLGTLLYLAKRYLGMPLPGALPLTPWRRERSPLSVGETGRP